MLQIYNILCIDATQIFFESFLFNFFNLTISWLLHKLFILAKIKLNWEGKMDNFGGIVVILIMVVIFLFLIVGMWKVFEKAGQPGWGIFIPIYNTYLMLKIANRPGWWLLLLFVPIVNFVIAIIMTVDIAKSFGKSSMYALGLILLGFIFYPMLGYGDAQWNLIER